MRRFVLLLPLVAASASAQIAPEAAYRAVSPSVWADSVREASLDVRVLRGVYGLGEPFATTFRVLDRTSMGVIAAVPAGLAADAYLNDGSYRPALRALLAEGATAGTVLVAKKVVGRPRPFEVVPGIEARTGGVHRGASMPSGHSALSFAAATTLSLSHPKAAVPAYAWATGVALGRVWHGVHYPSDVLTGAALGAGIAYGVHQLLPDEDAAAGPAAASSIAVPLGTVRLRF